MGNRKSLPPPAPPAPPAPPTPPAPPAPIPQLSGFIQGIDR